MRVNREYLNERDQLNREEMRQMKEPGPEEKEEMRSQNKQRICLRTNIIFFNE